MSQRVRRALYGRLTSDGGGAGGLTYREGNGGLLGAPAPGYTHSIYHGVAPADASYPIVTFNKQAGVATYSMQPLTKSGSSGGTAAYETEVWQVKAVDARPTAGSAEVVSDRVQLLLNDFDSVSSPLQGGGSIIYCRRESDVEFQEDSGGVRYQHVGALYRIMWAGTA